MRTPVSDRSSLGFTIAAGGWFNQFHCGWSDFILFRLISVFCYLIAFRAYFGILLSLRVFMRLVFF